MINIRSENTSIYIQVRTDIPPLEAPSREMSRVKRSHHFKTRFGVQEGLLCTAISANLRRTVISMATDKTTASFDAVTSKLGSLSAKDDVSNGKEDVKPTDDKAAEMPVESDLRESTYDVTVTLADQQADPNSPLFSVKAFEDLGLHENLLKGIYGMKYQKPSKIQERALPLLLQNP